HEDSIHSDSCIETLGDFNYIKFKSSILNNSNSLESLKYNLAESIKNNSFTYIEYKWDYSLIETNKEDTLSKIKHWVSNISDQEPCKSILRYKREDAYRVNMWIKNRCLSNGDSINTGDLLIVNSNVNIVDNTGIGTPTRINNGDYLLIVENIREEVIQQSIKQSRFPVPLYFTRALVKCISHPEKVVTEVLLLSNQLKNSDNLTKEEQIAIKVLISTRVKNKTKKDPFENSSEYRSMLVDQSYADLEVEIEKLEQQLESGFKVKTKLEGKRIEQNKIIKLYKSRYNRTIRREIYIEDPYVNAINCNYGWALTVHKAVGSEFEEIIFDVDQGNNQGNNESYFRWLYSGLNSSNRIVNILNQLSIHPMKGCRIELEPSAHSSSKSKYQKLDFRYSGIEYKKYSEMVISNVNYLIKVIEMQYGSLWKYYSVARKGAYQTKLTLLNTVSEEQYEFIISNDGKENITSIRATKLDDKSSGIIKSIYSFEVIEKSDELPSYLNSINKVYDQWKEIAVQYDIEVIVKNRMPWYDIIEIKGKDEVIDLKMTYNKKGFFSKAQFLTEEKSKFVKQIMSIIKHD
ncbi:MAG: hypothetical protein KC414_08955, partial [Romboutsia sp.]|nr:hypothetical protein [Romboutsia sp.]